MEKRTAFARKPHRETAREADVFAVIEKGGSSATGARPGSPSKDRAMNLRIPAHLAQKMDEALSARTVRISKNTWILEAIAEKSQRELVPEV